MNGSQPRQDCKDSSDSESIQVCQVAVTQELIPKEQPVTDSEMASHTSVKNKTLGFLLFQLTHCTHLFKGRHSGHGSGQSSVSM